MLLDVASHQQIRLAQVMDELRLASVARDAALQQLALCKDEITAVQLLVFLC